MYMQCMPVRYAFEVLGWVLAGETVVMYLALFNLAYNFSSCKYSNWISFFHFIFKKLD